MRVESVSRADFRCTFHHRDNHGIQRNDTRIFSPLAVAGLSVTFGRYWYLFKRLTLPSPGRFYRFEHIVAYSSSKVVAKSDASRGGIVKRSFEYHYFQRSAASSSCKK